MKKLLSLAFLTICILSLNAQDKITLKNGTELDVFIIEKTDKEIKYRVADLETTTFITKHSNLQKIEYQNGDIDYLSSKNPRCMHPFGLSGGISLYLSDSDAGGMFTTNMDYFFTPNMSAEINLGTNGNDFIDFYYSVGSKYWFADKYSRSGFSPFTGLLVGGQYGVNFWEIPLGVSYITKFGLQTSLHFSYMHFITSSVYNDISRLNGEVRIGWRF